METTTRRMRRIANLESWKTNRRSIRSRRAEKIALSKGPTPKQVAAGAANSVGVSCGVIYFG
jgi:hypothetical protein